MVGNIRPFILIAEDDPDDRLLVGDAFHTTAPWVDFRFVEDGIDLLDYLYQSIQSSDSSDSPIPGLVILDLKMPRKNGWEALRDMKDTPSYCHIPVVILTTSMSDDDHCLADKMGAEAYYTKPSSYHKLIEIIREISGMIDRNETFQ